MPWNLFNYNVWCKNKKFQIWNQKCFNWLFWAAILKNHCHSWNQNSPVCVILNFGAKTKILKFGTKYGLFRYFQVGIWKNYFHIWDKLYVSKMLYFEFFGLEFENNIVIFEIGTFKFAKNNLLMHTMNFGIESPFSKCPGSAFSQCLGPLWGTHFHSICNGSNSYHDSTHPSLPFEKWSLFLVLYTKNPKILFAAQNKKKDIVCKTT